MLLNTKFWGANMSNKLLHLNHKKGSSNFETRDERFIAAVELLKSLVMEDISDKIDIENIELSMSKLFKHLLKCTTEKIVTEKEPTEMFCPNCDEQMEIKDKRKKRIKGLSEYTFYRRNFYCKICNKYIRPMDDIINCPDYFSPKIKETMVLLGQRIPFEEARQFIEKLLGVDVNHVSIQTLTEETGNKVYKENKERVKELINKEGYIKKKHYPEKVKTKKGVAYMQVDGCMAQTREDGWKECRNGILFSSNNRAKISKGRNQILEKQHFSIFNKRKNSLEEFKRTATAQAHDFEFYAYEKQVIIGDGAGWIWNYADMFHHEAIQILDYYHASEYLGDAFQSFGFEEDHDKKQIKDQVFDLLWNGKIKEIIAWLHKQKQTEKVKACIRYYDNNKFRMNYADYRAQGLDIGSGAIESANRTIVQVRMKHSGMHWGKKNVQKMVSLRCAYLSGKWDNIYEKHINRAA